MLYSVCARVFAHLLLRPAAAECPPCSPVRCGPRPPPRWPLRPTGAGERHTTSVILGNVWHAVTYLWTDLWPHICHSNVLKYSITSTVSSGQPQTIVPMQRDIYPQVNLIKEQFFPTCTTEMCPCRTAKVRAAQWRLSGCTEGCFGEHGGTWQHRTKHSVTHRYQGHTLLKTPQ